MFAFITSQQYLNNARQDFDSALLNLAIDLAGQVKLENSDFTSRIELPRKEMIKQFPFPLGLTTFFVRSIDGKILASSQSEENLQDFIPYNKDLALKEDYTHRFQEVIYKEKPLRAINIKLTSQSGQALILQVATPSDILKSQESRFFWLNILTIPLFIITSSFAAFIIAGRALSPVKLLTEIADNIAAKNLSQRVPEFQTRDEIGNLSRTLNSLLSRLEKSFKAQENFVANASHQLNTPLAIIKGELDVLESKTRSPEETVRFQKSLREELERLIELVRNMLLISRVEAGQENFIFNDVRLDELLLGVSSRLGSKAREKSITLGFNIDEQLLDSDDVIVQGEKQLLECLFENLLDNAIKYSPEESTIKILMKESAGRLEVMLQDQGPGIEENDLKDILSQRFHRGSKVLLPGTGIGLSIAYQIADHHKATITYTKTEPKGSLFTISFSKQKVL